jgi:hypothetical protein
VHPIAGGLGMNTGMQDAYNLGWKLGLVLAGDAPPSLLDSYDEERLPIASRLLDITSERMAAALAAIKVVGGGVDAVAAPELSQLQIGYRWSRLSAETNAETNADAASLPGGLRAGDRAPDAPCRDAATGATVRLFDLYRGPHFTLLGLGQRTAAALAGARSDLVKPYLIGPGGLVDEGGHVARGYGEDALVLVRPDGHVGLIAGPDDARAVAEYPRSRYPAAATNQPAS